MAVAIPAAIGALGSLGGAALGGKAAQNAAKIQAQTAANALDYQKGLEATRKAEYDKAMTAYQAKYDAWNNNRNALLQRYGIDIPSAPPAAVGPGGPAPAGMPPGAAPGGMPSGPPGTGAPMSGGPITLGQIMSQGTPALGLPPGLPGAPSTPPNVGNWNDWQRYGLRT
jgi:hypothetical protein